MRVAWSIPDTSLLKLSKIGFLLVIEAVVLIIPQMLYLCGGENIGRLYVGLEGSEVGHEGLILLEECISGLVDKRGLHSADHAIKCGHALSISFLVPSSLPYAK